ncbi:unnamed protein product [Oncorhynchus mykiss]|uniref:Ig-like domain-containing protein n=1 Tax=Oncorhynchus mykiss TaxID=8022 RepID=A0A060YGH9_ONCMY|nr:unnamed protein product [Oncorhynchus mykiss]
MRLDLGELRRLEYISDGAFEGLQNLKYLNLGMCNLREMPVLSPLTGLEELEMSENTFPEMKPGSFRGLRSLQKLWIMNSGITYLVELHLHHNPWRCDCDVVWLSWWLREYIPTNSTCCGRCHSPAHMRGRYLVEVDQTTFQCSAPFILDAPRDLNISAERVAELKCLTAAMSSVRWLLPNGTVLTHGSSHPRISVLNDGTLNFSNVLPSDKGVYTCMVTNMAGNSNASAYLNVSNAELNTSNLSYFTTVTVEVLEPTVEETPKPKPTVPASPSVFQPVFISTPTMLLQSTQTPRQVSLPTARGPTHPSASLDEVVKTTKIIIGCFVAVTLLAAAMLIAFYKLRKRHQQRSTVAVARTIEIIQMDEEVPEVPPARSGSSESEEMGLALPTILKARYISSSSSAAYGAHWTHNNLGNSLHRSSSRQHHQQHHHSLISTIAEPYVIKTTHTKEKVQETQI